MMTFQGQKLKKWVPIAGAIGLALVVLLLIVIAVRRPKVLPEYYSERQTANNGVVYVERPDHGYWYYYWMAQMNRPVQPTYHRYTPPPAYPQISPAETGYQPGTTQIVIDPKRTGGWTQPAGGSSEQGSHYPPGHVMEDKTYRPFPDTKFVKPNRVEPASPKTSGGWTRPAAPTNPRTSGGWAGTKSTSPKTSGGWGGTRKK